VYKIAIAGASTLLGKELKDAISDSTLAAATFALLDEDQALGQLDQVGDEITFVQPIAPDSFEHVDFTFFCGSEALTNRHWRSAVAAGSTVIDLSGALDEEPGVLIRAPWLESDSATPDLFTPGVVPAHPAAITLGLLLEGLQQAGAVKAAAATLLAPASEFGRGAMDELHQQTVSLLSFQPIPRAVYDAQAAYNLLTGFGESAQISLTALEARVHRHYNALGGGRWPLLGLQTIAAPVFHGHAYSISVEFERPLDIPLIEDSLNGEHIELILEDTDSPSNLAATGQNGVLARMRPVQDGRNPNQASRLWLWAASDNLRLYAQNAVECALELRKLRPHGKVQ
jgi:aspartate-semialdehyde dehydrogenase